MPDFCRFCVILYSTQALIWPSPIVTGARVEAGLPVRRLRYLLHDILPLCFAVWLTPVQLEEQDKISPNRGSRSSNHTAELEEKKTDGVVQAGDYIQYLVFSRSCFSLFLICFLELLVLYQNLKKQQQVLSSRLLLLLGCKHPGRLERRVKLSECWIIEIRGQVVVTCLWTELLGLNRTLRNQEFTGLPELCVCLCDWALFTRTST